MSYSIILLSIFLINGETREMNFITDLPKENCESGAFTLAPLVEEFIDLPIMALTVECTWEQAS